MYQHNGLLNLNQPDRLMSDRTLFLSNCKLQLTQMLYALINGKCFDCNNIAIKFSFTGYKTQVSWWQMNTLLLNKSRVLRASIGPCLSPGILFKFFLQFINKRKKTMQQGGTFTMCYTARFMKICSFESFCMKV